MIQLPPSLVIFFCLLLFGFGELAGAMLGGFPQQIKNMTRSQALARPDVHGLVGVEDIDRAILEDLGSEALARVHTFHLHAHGLALAVFVLSLILANMQLNPRAKRLMLGLLSLGMVYPFGWLLMALFIPIFGKGGAFRLAERLFFVPFGSAFLVMIWLLIIVYAGKMLLAHRKVGTH